MCHRRRRRSNGHIVKLYIEISDHINSSANYYVLFFFLFETRMDKSGVVAGSGVVVVVVVFVSFFQSTGEGQMVTRE